VATGPLEQAARAGRALLGGGRGKPLPPKTVLIEQAIRGILAKSDAPGDYLEFGVFRGDSLAAAWRGAVAGGLDGMRLFGFDSFEGLPEGRRAAEVGRWAPGSMAAGEEAVRQNLTRLGVDLSRVTLVPGFFDEVLDDNLRQRFGLRRAAVVYLDADLYDSTLTALRWVTPLLATGTLLAVDDWFTFRTQPGAGARGAVMEWLRDDHGLTLVPFRSAGVNFEAFFVQTAADVGPMTVR
jgi:O-methyltransferase